MLRIHPEQAAAFEAAAVRDFEARMVGHLRRFFPEECRRLGAQGDEDGVRALIRHGIARAQTYGIVSEHDVTLYLNLTMALGRDFDRDALLPWARAVLVETELPEPSRRMARLYRETLERTQVPGDDEHGD
jgi:hypothetical protein